MYERAGTPTLLSLRAVFLIVLFLLFNCISDSVRLLIAAPRQRGGTPAPMPVAKETGKRLFVMIGVDDYAGWPKLHTAVSDATGVQKVLEGKFGFHAAAPSLIDRRATRAAIQSLIDDSLRKALQADDQLILFFAGHGHTRIDKVGDKEIETGFLVPADAPPASHDAWSSYIQIDGFLESIAKLPAKHILVILDSCHSGFGVGSALTFRSANRYQQDLARHVSRRVVTSARRDQLARDNGPTPGHSLFTGILIEGLSSGRADIDGNGLITSSEIGLYLQQAVGQQTASRQVPDFGAFQLDDRGEMALNLRDDTFSALNARARTALHRGESEQFNSLLARAAVLRPDAPETLYLQYRSDLIAGRWFDAAQRIGRLLDISAPPGVIPLSIDNLWDLNRQLSFWKPILSLKEVNFPLDVEFQAGPSPEQMKTIQPELLGDLVGYRFPPGSSFRFRVQNKSSNQIFLYCISFDQNGRLEVFELLHSESPFTGLAPGVSASTAGFRQDGEVGLEQFLLVATPHYDTTLLSPPSPKQRGFVSEGRWTPQTLRDYSKHVVRFIVSDRP